MVEHHVHGGEFLAEDRGHAPAQGQLAPGPLRGRHADNIGGAAEAADHAGGAAGDGADHDTFGAYVNGHGAGGVGNCVQRVENFKIRGVEAVDIADVLFRIFGDFRHVFDGGHGIFTGGSLTGEHHRRRAVVDRVGDIGNFRPGGAGIVNHRLQHLRGRDDPFAQKAAFVNQELLNGRNLYKGNFHPQIAPGYHDAVGYLADLFNVVHTGAVLNFCNHVNIAAAVFVQKGPQVFHILPGGDKGGRHKIHAVLNAEEQVLFILLAEEIVGQDAVGKIHAFPIGQVAAGHHPAQGVAALQLLHAENHQTVVDHDGVADLQIVDEALIGDGHPSLISDDILGGEGKHVAVLERDLFVFESFDAVFRPLGVEHDRNGQLQLLPNPLDQVDFLLVLLVRAVRKIEARDIHARQAHLRQGFLVFAGRPDGADNFRFPHWDNLPILFLISSYHELRNFQVRFRMFLKIQQDAQ